MKTHTIVVVEHFYKDGVNLDHDPDEVTSDFRISYANEKQHQAAIAAVQIYLESIGLPKLEDIPPYDLTDYPEIQSEFYCTEGKNIAVAVYTYRE